MPAVRGYRSVPYTLDEVERIKAAAREAIANGRRVIPALRAIVGTFTNPKRGSSALYMKWLSIAGTGELGPHRSMSRSPSHRAAAREALKLKAEAEVKVKVHGPPKLPVAESGFILAPTKAQLMAGR